MKKVVDLAEVRQRRNQTIDKAIAVIHKALRARANGRDACLFRSTLTLEHRDRVLGNESERADLLIKCNCIGLGDTEVKHSLIRYPARTRRVLDGLRNAMSPNTYVMAFGRFVDHGSGYPPVGFEAEDFLPPPDEVMAAVDIALPKPSDPDLISVPKEIDRVSLLSRSATELDININIYEPTRISLNSEQAIMAAYQYAGFGKWQFDADHGLTVTEDNLGNLRLVDEHNDVTLDKRENKLFRYVSDQWFELYLWTILDDEAPVMNKLSGIWPEAIDALFGNLMIIEEQLDGEPGRYDAYKARVSPNDHWLSLAAEKSETKHYAGSFTLVLEYDEDENQDARHLRSFFPEGVEADTEIVDYLGLYCCKGTPGYEHVIVLKMRKIRDCADRLLVCPKALLYKVLCHEWAHLIHCQNHRDGFLKSDTKMREQCAQLFTWNALKDRASELLAFLVLSTKQEAHYQSWGDLVHHKKSCLSHRMQGNASCTCPESPYSRFALNVDPEDKTLLVYQASDARPSQGLVIPDDFADNVIISGHDLNDKALKGIENASIRGTLVFLNCRIESFENLPHTINRLVIVGNDKEKNRVSAWYDHKSRRRIGKTCNELHVFSHYPLYEMLMLYSWKGLKLTHSSSDLNGLPAAGTCDLLGAQQWLVDHDLHDFAQMKRNRQ